MMKNKSLLDKCIESLSYDDCIISDEQTLIEQLKDYAYLFDFYKKHYEELKLANNKMLVHSRFVDYLRDKIYECTDKLLRLEIQKRFDKDV